MCFVCLQICRLYYLNMQDSWQWCCTCSQGVNFSVARVYMTSHITVPQWESWRLVAGHHQSCHSRQRESYVSWIQSQWGLFWSIVCNSAPCPGSRASGDCLKHRVQFCSEVYYTTPKSMHIPEFRCDLVTLLIIKPMIAENHVCICFRV